VLRPPDAAEALVGVPLERLFVPGAVPVDDRPGEDADVVDREVQALRAGRRNDVRGVPGQEQAAVLHRLDDEAAHPGDALLEHRALGEGPAGEPDPDLQLLPYPLVRPRGEVLVRAALQVVAAQLRRAQAEQREAALVGRVDELADRGRDRREDSQPAERVLARELGEHAGRDARAADAVEAVAAGDHVALERLGRAVVAERQPGPLGLEVGDRDVVDLEQQRPAGVEPRLDQILDDLGLAVDDDRLPGQLVERDAMTLAVELELDAVVDDSLALHPLAHPRLGEQVGGSLLEDAGADPRLYILAGAALDHHRVDALEVQEVRERQARGAGADDPDLRPRHAAPSSSSTCWAIAKAAFAAGTPQ
jgi:hypothetical protein